jgi:hypothetical protein
MLGIGISEAFFTEDDIANLSDKENQGNFAERLFFALIITLFTAGFNLMTPVP